MITFWDIVEELDRQRWEASMNWTSEQWDIFNTLRDFCFAKAELDDIYEGEE